MKRNLNTAMGIDSQEAERQVKTSSTNRYSFQEEYSKLHEMQYLNNIILENVRPALKSFDIAQARFFLKMLAESKWPNKEIKLIYEELLNEKYDNPNHSKIFEDVNHLSFKLFGATFVDMTEEQIIGQEEPQIEWAHDIDSMDFDDCIYPPLPSLK